MEKNKKARLIAFYLPQFHPIPENDEWWGKGFTEWTNVRKTRPLFKGHYQPIEPGEFGYYDLRDPRIRKIQAETAEKYGIEGFCYWHYRFEDGKRLLEMPFNEVLKTGEPDFPFCLGWANETWKGLPHGLKNKKNVLIEQKYSGVNDYEAHFYEVLPALVDKRYITVDKKPLFLIYKPFINKELKVFIETWRNLAIRNGLPGIHFVGHVIKSGQIKSKDKFGYDSLNISRLYDIPILFKIYKRILKDIFNVPVRYKYKTAVNFWLLRNKEKEEFYFPTVVPNWDHSPRSGRNAVILHDSNPDIFKEHLRKAVESVKEKQEEHRIIFLKSWNEWGEGNYLEPDAKYGYRYLEKIKEVLQSE